MRSALLCASSAEKLFLISRLSRSAERSKRIFTGGVVKASGICSAAFCESAALRESFWSNRKVCGSARSPERADFPRPGEDVTAGDKKGNLSRSD